MIGVTSWIIQSPVHFICKIKIHKKTDFKQIFSITIKKEMKMMFFKKEERKRNSLLTRRNLQQIQVQC